jgi:hypothetical protein
MISFFCRAIFQLSEITIIIVQKVANSQVWGYPFSWNVCAVFSLFTVRPSAAIACRRVPTLMASQKLPNCCVALHPSSLRRTVCTPQSSGFARLAFGAFCLAITIDDFLRFHHP